MYCEPIAPCSRGGGGAEGLVARGVRQGTLWIYFILYILYNKEDSLYGFLYVISLWICSEDLFAQPPLADPRLPLLHRRPAWRGATALHSCRRVDKKSITCMQYIVYIWLPSYLAI